VHEPFFWLQGLVALNTFIISTTVLICQNRMSTLASQHAHLDLQVNLLADQYRDCAVHQRGIVRAAQLREKVAIVSWRISPYH